jgi:TolB-like protein
MTTVDAVYRYGATPSASAVQAIARLREVYGVRAVQFKELEKTVRVEYDSTRLTEPVIHQLLRRAGLDVLDRLTLYTIPPPPEPATEAAPATK